MAPSSARFALLLCPSCGFLQPLIYPLDIRGCVIACSQGCTRCKTAIPVPDIFDGMMFPSPGSASVFVLELIAKAASAVEPRPEPKENPKEAEGDLTSALMSLWKDLTPAQASIINRLILCLLFMIGGPNAASLLRNPGKLTNRDQVNAPPTLNTIKKDIRSLEAEHEQFSRRLTELVDSMTRGMLVVAETRSDAEARLSEILRIYNDLNDAIRAISAEIARERVMQIQIIESKPVGTAAAVQRLAGESGRIPDDFVQ